MDKNNLIDKLNTVEKIASISKVGRLLHNPIKYVYAIVLKNFIYPKNKKEKIVSAALFYGTEMKVALPAATDIYLTGGKSHASEIRLAKLLILNLNDAQHFLDIGAHYGYFTLIASEMVGKMGKIISFEPAKKTFDLLNENTQSLSNITTFKKAVSNTTEKIVFYEFPNLQSEYNSSDVTQFEQEQWFKDASPVKVEVDATTIDAITKDGTFKPVIIKIDVEGAELNVIQGGIHYFTEHAPLIVMEYLEPKRKNENHKKATDLLKSIGYNTFIITDEGNLKAINDIDSYLEQQKLESDNIVFSKG